MTDSKILPFDCNVVYSLDCRVSCRLGIIQTSPFGRAWLATHLDILMSDTLDLNFGNGIYVNQMNYYDDILDTREIDLWSSVPNNIVDIVIEQINNDRYVLIDLYWQDQFPSDADNPRTHSGTIIGYDTKKRVFISVGLFDHKYVCSEIEFDLFKLLYEDAIKQYLFDPDSKTLRQMFYFTITSIGLKNDISTDNYIFNAIVNKLGHEESGACIEVTRKKADESVDTVNKYYTGTSCILGIRNYIQTILASNNIEDYYEKTPCIVRTLYGLAEHRNIIVMTMEWIIKAIICNDATVIEAFEKYQTAPNVMRYGSILVQKFDVTKDIDILKRVELKLKSQYEYEKNVLKCFVDNSFAFYKRFNGYDEHSRKTEKNI